MELQIQGFGIDNTEFYQQSLNIRQTVLVQEGGLDKHVEFDSFDSSALHFIMINNDKTIGCIRCTESNNELLIDRFCIIKEFRNKGFGIVFIKFVLSELLPSKKVIKIISTSKNERFLRKIGFTELVENKIIGSYNVKILKFLNG